MAFEVVWQPPASTWLRVAHRVPRDRLSCIDRPRRPRRLLDHELWPLASSACFPTRAIGTTPLVGSAVCRRRDDRHESVSLASTIPALSQTSRTATDRAAARGSSPRRVESTRFTSASRGRRSPWTGAPSGRLVADHLYGPLAHPQVDVIARDLHQPAACWPSSPAAGTEVVGRGSVADSTKSASSSVPRIASSLAIRALAARHEIVAVEISATAWHRVPERPSSGNPGHRSAVQVRRTSDRRHRYVGVQSRRHPCSVRDSPS